MESFERFTEDEIVWIFEEICDAVEVEFDDEDEDEEGGVTLNCEVGEIKFRSHLIGSNPFYDGLSLLSARGVEANPLHFCNEFNQGGGIARAYLNTPFDDEDINDQDENGNALVFARLFVHFGGGITMAHLYFLLTVWIDELRSFNGLQAEWEEELPELDAAIKVPVDLAGPSVSLSERVIAFLTLNGGSTAREISKALRLDRQKVNRLLYKSPKSFSKSTDQPPIWSINN